MTRFIVGRKHPARIAVRITLQPRQKGVVLDADTRAPIDVVPEKAVC
jgi:hypothetical protein